MRDSQRRRAEHLFQKALDLPASRRMEYLEEQGDDPVVTREVEELLASCDDESLLDRIEEDGMATLLGQQIGPYRIVELIGEGGFGSVYLADQEEPIQRQVALKVIKLGMDTRQVIARFEMERQALALMDHPNIAKVLDAGATETGRPYFVMERVHGVPITDYCDERGVSMRERLRLFISVCQAVQHAHQKGIIHRDIKPSNVLVTMNDNVPVPKVIDFGIAKATDRRLTALTLATGSCQLIGTPEYMSPEQADSGGGDIDTRTDVYSLGVLLYELLTGKTPLKRTAFGQARPSEIQRIIREEAPTAPSRRVSRLGSELLAVARSRRVHPSLLSRLIKGDLDWIVMRALEKDRSRRYETASSLASDVVHHLNHEPVLAGPPGALYRMRKFIRRNRVSVVTTSLIATALLIGLALATLGFLDATTARRNESAQRTRAERSARLAFDQASKADAVKRFLQGMLESADPSRAPDRVITMRFILDEATQKIDRDALAGQPEVEADVRVTLGRSYASFGLYDPAETHLRTAVALLTQELGRDDPATLEAECWLSTVLLDRGRLAEAETRLDRALRAARRTLGDEHPLTALIMNARALSFRRRGRYEDAESLHRKAAAVQRRRLGEEHRYTLESMSGRADALAKARRYAEAEALFRRILDIRRLVFGDVDIDTLVTMISLGHVLRKHGKVDEAVDVLSTAHESLVRLLGPRHPRALSSRYRMALAIRDQGGIERAEPLLRETFETQREVLGELHPDTANTFTDLLMVLRSLGKTDEIETRSASMLAKMRAAAEQESADAHALNRLAWMLLTCEHVPFRDPEQALPVAQQAVVLTESRNAVILDTLAVAFYQTGDLRSAIEIQRKAVALAGARGRSRLTDSEARLVAWMFEDRGFRGTLQASCFILAVRAQAAAY